MHATKENYTTKTISRKQELFLKYFTFTLVDLVVLNLFAQYWDKVTITSFGVSLLIAVVLQILLKLTLVLEHRVGDYFKSDDSIKMKIYRILSAWLILFVSKFVILWVLELIFVKEIIFLGMWHGVITFIVVVVAILLVEYLVTRIYRALA
jgi:hypothetical protein